MVAEKEVCITAGRTAGGFMRFILETVKKTGKFGENIISTTEACLKATGNAFNTACAKGDNFFKRIGYGSNLAVWENKQKDVFVKIGQKIFSERELKKNKTPVEIIKDKKIEALFMKANMYEKEIERIKEESELQQESMVTLAIINRAEEDLKSADPKHRIIALRLLEKVGTKEVLPILTEALNDFEDEVRLRAGEIIIELEKSLKKNRSKNYFKINSKEEGSLVLKKKKSIKIKKVASKDITPSQSVAVVKPNEQGAN